MRSVTHWVTDHGHARSALATALLLAMLGAGGCAQMGRLKDRLGEHFGHHKTSAAAPTPVGAPRAAPLPVVPDRSLAQIVNGELQHGRYAAGAEQLRRYLDAHPGDRAAQVLLQQVTADPQKMLGSASRTYTVRPGDSYSTLAARFLHDASQFLILARYNHADDPSVLRIGQQLRVPLSDGVPGDHGDAAVASPPVETMVVVADGPSDDALAKAARLQQESLALLDQGRQRQALARLDEALELDPRLAAGANEPALRQKVLAALHQRAIVLYRDQQLDQAIALWDHVLAIDPAYERAVVYRTRALELKRRLRQL